jgi:hypothetical protein
LTVFRSGKGNDVVLKADRESGSRLVVEGCASPGDPNPSSALPKRKPAAARPMAGVFLKE